MNRESFPNQDESEMLFEKALRARQEMYKEKNEKTLAEFKKAERELILAAQKAHRENDKKKLSEFIMELYWNFIIKAAKKICETLHQFSHSKALNQFYVVEQNDGEKLRNEVSRKLAKVENEKAPDIIAIGISGLLDAIANFDASRQEIFFFPYAAERIKGAIRDYFTKEVFNKFLPLPRRLASLSWKVKKAINILTNERDYITDEHLIIQTMLLYIEQGKNIEQVKEQVKNLSKVYRDFIVKVATEKERRKPSAASIAEALSEQIPEKIRQEINGAKEALALKCVGLEEYIEQTNEEESEEIQIPRRLASLSWKVKKAINILTNERDYITDEHLIIQTMLLYIEQGKNIEQVKEQVKNLSKVYRDFIVKVATEKERRKPSAASIAEALSEQIPEKIRQEINGAKEALALKCVGLEEYIEQTHEEESKEIQIQKLLLSLAQQDEAPVLKNMLMTHTQEESFAESEISEEEEESGSLSKLKTVLKKSIESLTDIQRKAILDYYFISESDEMQNNVSESSTERKRRSDALDVLAKYLWQNAERELLVYYHKNISEIKREKTENQK